MSEISQNIAPTPLTRFLVGLFFSGLVLFRRSLPEILVKVRFLETEWQKFRLVSDSRQSRRLRGNVNIWTTALLSIRM